MLKPARSSLQLILVRHGETEWTERGLLHGRLDSLLSSTGRRHAELTAHRLRRGKFDALYTSPQGRAVQTATVLGEALGLTPIPLEGLREMDFGWSEGRPLRLFDPDGSGARLFRPLTRMMFILTAERPNRFAARVNSAVETMRANHPNGRVLVVTHWAVLSMLKALLLDGHNHAWMSYGPWAACGISELHAVENSWQIVYLNDDSHIHEKRQT